MQNRTLPSLCGLALLAGCGGIDWTEVDAIDAPVELPLSPAEERGVLALVNDCTTTLAVLDDDAALERRAAVNIIGHRDGADTRCGTADDDRFGDLRELDDVPYVGDAAINRLLAHAQARGYVEADDGVVLVEGVAFSRAEMEAVIALCNCASLAELDDDAGLDARAASGIVAARPFADTDPVVNMQRLAAVSYVGATALERLKAFAAGWQGSCAALGGTFDGVLFGDAQARTALAVLNSATRGQLRQDVGYSKLITDHVVTGRPWADLQAFAARSGIGPATLNTLRVFVDSGLWQGPGPMQTALTVAELAARAAELDGQFVSFNRVLATSAGGSGTFEARVQDAAGDTVSARLYRVLCNPISEACVAAPPIAAGEEFELVHARVVVDSGRLSLNLVDTTEVAPLGCWEGFSRSCGLQVGVCTVGTETCVADRWAACTGLVNQLASDPPDGLDNDCDGRVDENSLVIRLLGHLAEPVRALGLGGAGSVASSGQEMLRLDLSDPERPTVAERLAQVDVGKPSIRVDAGQAVMAACRSGTRTYDLPASDLTPAQSLPLTIALASVGCVRDALRVGDLLYTADVYNGVFVYDVSGTAPVLRVHLPIRNAQALEVVGDHVIVLADALWVYDLTRPDAPVQGPLAGGNDLALSAAGLLAVAGASGVRLYDAAEPAHLRAYTTPAPVQAAGLTFDGSLLVATPSSLDRVVRVIETADPAAPRVVAEVLVPNPDGVVFGSALDGAQLADGILHVYGGTGLHLFSLTTE